MATDYGTDVSCTLRTVNLEMPDGSFRDVVAVQFSASMTEVQGRTCLAEALLRRLTTDRGALIDVFIPTTTGNYGTNVQEWLNDDMDARTLGMMSAGIDAEMLKDERVVASKTAATLVGALLIVTIDITDGVGPFKLVLSISQAAVQLLQGPS